MAFVARRALLAVARRAPTTVTALLTASRGIACLPAVQPRKLGHVKAPSCAVRYLSDSPEGGDDSHANWQARTLFVGNLAYTVLAEDLDRAFSPFGRVENAKIITDRETFRSRGFGFVTLDSVEAAQQACDQLQMTQLVGREMVISFSKGQQPQQQRPAYQKRAPPAPAQPSNKLFVGNLPPNSAEEDLEKLFAGVDAKPVSCKVLRDPITALSRGFGFVEFADTEQATAALNALQEPHVNGQPIRVSWAGTKQKRSRWQRPRQQQDDGFDV